jgi:hypothetical protein
MTMMPKEMIIMNPKTFIQLLGTAADDLNVERLLRSYGVTTMPKLKRGDTDVNVEVPEAGLYFVFTDEGFFDERSGLAIRAGALLLTNVTMYCQDISGFRAYTSGLPFGIVRSDSRAAVRAKLGAPEIADDDLRMDRWSRDGVWAFVNYTDRPPFLIENVSVQIPDPA